VPRVTLHPAHTLLVADGRVASFDLEGRLITYFEEDTLYKRALDSRVHTRRRVGGRRVRGVLSDEEALIVFARARELALAHLPGARGEERRRLLDILDYTPERLLAERERFYRVYEPIAILPPDRYLAVVLQATSGCTWNRCTFCSFYSGRPFSAKDPASFRAHARAVREFLGRGALLRRGLFLADGNALALSAGRLLPLFDAAREVFPGQPVYGFLDVYSGERRGREFWRALAEQGLAGVYIGMETGHDPLLAWLNKPGGSEELYALVKDLKAAGLFVGLIVMVGVGGRRYQEPHFEETMRLLARLPLSREDLVFLSPFIEDPSSSYARLRIEEGIPALSEEETEAELLCPCGAGPRPSRRPLRHPGVSLLDKAQPAGLLQGLDAAVGVKL